MWPLRDGKYHDIFKKKSKIWDIFDIFDIYMIFSIVMFKNKNLY